jgi:hypothetical protein
MRKDTGHKIYTGSGRQGGELYVLFGGSSMAPCAWCWVEIKLGARLGTRPSFIYSRGWIRSRLQGRNPSRITWNES